MNGIKMMTMMVGLILIVLKPGDRPHHDLAQARVPIKPFNSLLSSHSDGRPVVVVPNHDYHGGSRVLLYTII